MVGTPPVTTRMGRPECTSTACNILVNVMEPSGLADEIGDATSLAVGAVRPRGRGRVVPGEMQPADRLLETGNGSRALRREDREAVFPRLQVRAEHPTPEVGDHGEELLDPRGGCAGVRSEIGAVPGGVAVAD